MCVGGEGWVEAPLNSLHKLMGQTESIFRDTLSCFLLELKLESTKWGWEKSPYSFDQYINNKEPENSWPAIIKCRAVTNTSVAEAWPIITCYLFFSFSSHSSSALTGRTTGLLNS